MIWDMGVVHRVMGYQLRQGYTLEAVERGGEQFVAHLNRRMRSALLRTLDPLHIHPDDIEVVHQASTTQPFMCRALAHWRPALKEGELTGGFHDGRVVALPDPGQPVYTAEEPALAFMHRLETRPSPSLKATVWHVTGFNENTRRWVLEREP